MLDITLWQQKVIKEEFKDKKITLIYNSYEDKDYFEVLKVLKPIIKDFYIAFR